MNILWMIPLAPGIFVLWTSAPKLANQIELEQGGIRLETLHSQRLIRREATIHLLFVRSQQLVDGDHVELVLRARDGRDRRGRVRLSLPKWDTTGLKQVLSAVCDFIQLKAIDETKPFERYLSFQTAWQIPTLGYRRFGDWNVALISDENLSGTRFSGFGFDGKQAHRIDGHLVSLGEVVSLIWQGQPSRTIFLDGSDHLLELELSGTARERVAFEQSLLDLSEQELTGWLDCIMQLEVRGAGLTNFVSAVLNRRPADARGMAPIVTHTGTDVIACIEPKSFMDGQPRTTLNFDLDQASEAAEIISCSNDDTGGAIIVAHPRGRVPQICRIEIDGFEGPCWRPVRSLNDQALRNSLRQFCQKHSVSAEGISRLLVPLLRTSAAQPSLALRRISLWEIKHERDPLTIVVLCGNDIGEIERTLVAFAGLPTALPLQVTLVADDGITVEAVGHFTTELGQNFGIAVDLILYEAGRTLSQTLINLGAVDRPAFVLPAGAVPANDQLLMRWADHFPAEIPSLTMDCLISSASRRQLPSNLANFNSGSFRGLAVSRLDLLREINPAIESWEGICAALLLFPPRDAKILFSELFARPSVDINANRHFKCRTDQAILEVLQAEQDIRASAS